MSGATVFRENAVGSQKHWTPWAIVVTPDHAKRLRRCSCTGGAVTHPGQGAGIAAALSLHDGVTLERLDIGRIQRELDRQGVRYL